MLHIYLILLHILVVPLDLHPSDIATASRLELGRRARTSLGRFVCRTVLERCGRARDAARCTRPPTDFGVAKPSDIFRYRYNFAP